MGQQSFGYWLKLKRKALDLTREDLAKQVGYSAATIRKIEDEERHPSVQVAERLAEVFQIPQNERTDFLRFARGERKSAPIETKAESPWQSSVKLPRSNIPATVTSLVGREQEIADIHDYLLKEDIRVVTLIGPPGIGKTRLSIEAARSVLPDFLDGAFFAALAPLVDPSLIAVTVAQALGHVGTQNSSVEEQLKAGIGEKQMLLVLDNCEHLIEQVASIVFDLLAACPQLKILATSRESLRIFGEWLYPVPALDVQSFDVPKQISYGDVEMLSRLPALTLFAERARAVRPDFALDIENVKTVSAICARLDGLPLAIELIAARMRLMTPQVLLDRLSGQFVLTADGMRAASERQKTLNNAIDWSYNLLPLEEQKMFAYLSIFSGGFSLEAVEAIFPGKIIEKPLPTLIALLLDKSLLKLAPDAEAYAEARYTMLVTIQEYARERLQEMGEETEIRNEHLAYLLALAEKADKELRGRYQLEWLNRLNSDRDNLRAALGWAIETGQTGNALQLVRKLHGFWIILSNFNEGRQWFHRVLEMPDVSSYPEMHAEVLAQVANQTFLQIGPHQAKPYSEQALSIARAHQDKHNTARALVMLAVALSDQKNFAAAQAALEESRALFQEVQDEWGYGMSNLILGWSASRQEDWSTALMWQEEALAIFRKLGDRHFMGIVLRSIGRAKMRQGYLSQSETATKEALVLAQQIDSKFEIGWALWQFAVIAQHRDDFVRAVRLYEAARTIFEYIGTWRPEIKTHLEQSLSVCRTELGEAKLISAVEQGRAMTMEQAIAYALENEE